MKALRKLMTSALVLGCATVVVASPAIAWQPNKPIDFIIMAGKGGGADKMARLMQGIVEKESLAERPLVPVNKSGGSGAEALMAAKSASDPDHTIMVTLNSFYTTPLRQPGLEVDVLTFAPVARMAEDTFLLWVHADAGITTFEQWLDVARDQGSKWVMGGTGSNSEDNIITDFLNTNYGLSMKYIPYKGRGRGQGCCRQADQLVREQPVRSHRLLAVRRHGSAGRLHQRAPADVSGSSDAPREGR